MSKKIVLLAVCALVLVGSQSMAAIYETSFEASQGWPVAAPHTEITAGSVDGWSITRWGGQAFSEDWRSHTNQAVYMTMDNSASVELLRSFAPTSKATVEMWATTVASGPFQVRMMNSAGQDLANFAMWNGVIYKDMFGWVSSGDTYTPGAFIKLVYAIDVAQNKWTLSTFGNNPQVIQGTLGASGNVAKLQIGTNWTGGGGFGYAVVDDLVVTPEPFTMALMGLGALFAVRRK